jgi:predicted amidohydrolase
MFVLGRNGQLLGSQRKLHPIPVSEDWSHPVTLASPMTVDDVDVGLLVCADAQPPDDAADLRDAGAELLLSSAAWWPGRWRPHGEWEARTTETDLRMVVCNCTRTDGHAQLARAESVVIDRGQRLLALS